MCKYCNRKPVFDSAGYYETWSNKETVATGAYSSLSIGVDASGKLIILGGGDDDTEPYYPKYCPECGRKLT